MNAKRAATLLAVFFAVVVAGCVSQGTNVTYPNDVVIISDFSAAPASVAPSQSLTVKGYVINNGQEAISNITASLYDFCPGAFRVEEMKCGADIDRSGASKCSIGRLRPAESEEVWWKLRAFGPEAFGGLQFSCDVKAAVAYRFRTATIMPVTVVSQADYEQLSKGFTPQPVQIGYGPVKAELATKTPQPIIAGSSLDVTLAVINRASGYVPAKKLSKDDISLSLPAGFATGKNCDFEAVGSAYRPKRDVSVSSNDVDVLRCELNAPTDARAVSTYHMSASAQYDYEFRTSTATSINAPQ